MIRYVAAEDPTTRSRAIRPANHGETRVWGEAEDAAGTRVAAWLRGPQAYRWTALTALDAVEGILAGGVTPGFRTFAGAFGPDLVLRHGVERADLD